MKLYATLSSERASRPATKGGDEHLTIDVTGAGRKILQMRVHDAGDHWRITTNYRDGTYRDETTGVHFHSVPKN